MSRNVIELKKERYEKYKDLHKKNEKILKIIYYSLGIFSTMSSSIMTFLAGLSLNNQKDEQAVKWELVLSFCVLFINSLLNFGEIEKKISKHRDSRLQYDSLLIDIEEVFNDHDTSEDVLEEFFKLLCEKEKLLKGYESNTFCFN